MGGVKGVGMSGNQPQIINTQNTGNVVRIGGVRVDTTRPGAQPNIAPQIEIKPQAQPSRAADVVGQLDVLLLKAASGGINAEDVEKAAENAKLPEGTRTELKSLAETAQANLAALDRFTGKDLAAAMEKKEDGSIDWKNDSAVAEAFRAAQSAQEELSMALSNALGKAADGNTQATLEDLMLQCDMRFAEIDTLVLQMTEIIDKGGEDAQENAAALTKGGSISSFNSEYVLDKFGRNEMFNALKNDLQPLTVRLERYASSGVKDLDKADVKGCIKELNAIKAKFSAAATSGTVNIGGKTVLVDRSLLNEASKMLDDVGKKISAFHREVLHEAMVKLVENEIPFVNEELFSPKFAGEIGKLVNRDPNIKPKALGAYVKMINTFRSAASAYVDSPTKENATKLKNAAANLTMVDTDDVAKCLTAKAIAGLRAPDGASEDLKKALNNFKVNMLTSSGTEDDTPIKKLIRSYDHMDIAAEKLLSYGKEMNAGPSNKYYVSCAVLDVFKGETSLSPLIESRVHGYSDGDINIALDDKNVTGAKTLGSGSYNTVTLVTVKDGSEWVFKPEMAGRLTAPNSPLNDGMNINQEITRVNLAVQATADALELDDIMVKTSVGTHKGQFGMFMEKAPGISGKKFKESEQVEINQMNDADFGKLVGDMMRKLNRLQWFDMITGQGDRHADNYMINVNIDVPSVEIKAIDNDASYGIYRQGVNKFVLRQDMSMERGFRSALDKLTKGITIKKQNNTSSDPLVTRELERKTREARSDFVQSVLNDPGVTEGYNGTITIDLSKADNAFLLRSLLGSCGIKNIVPPAEIDQKLYEKLMTLAKGAPDGGKARKNYLDSLAQRLGKSSEQYKAAVQRLDESIAHAKKLYDEGKVYSEEDWRNHEIQRRIAVPNLDNKEMELDTNDVQISTRTTADFTRKGKYSGYSNTFFRDCYDVLIGNTTRKHWFT